MGEARGDRVRMEGKVALVTGGGRGIGRAIALALVREGCRVAVCARTTAEVEETARQGRALGGRVLALTADVSVEADAERAVAETIRELDGLDILVNNAGILRDKSFAKMDLADFRLVMDVHLMGAVHLTKAAWPHMVATKYGRVLMTTSSSGLYGNFGQSNYGAAKMALVGLMQTLSIEGAKNDIRVNCLAPTAATRMTEGLLPPEVLEALRPEAVVPAMLVAVSEQAPTRTIFAAGAGTYEAAHITLTKGVHLGLSADTPERLLAALGQVTDRTGETVPQSGAEQGTNEVTQALAARR